MLGRFFLASIKNIGYICLPLASVAELVDAPDSKSGSARSVGSIPTRGTQRDKSSFLDLSLFLFFRFTLLKWAILCKMGLISAVRTFLFSN